MPIGLPKYRVGDRVEFEVGGESWFGTVAIVDAYGTFGQHDEASYDVMVEDGPGGRPCLFKHLVESSVREAGA